MEGWGQKNTHCEPSWLESTCVGLSAVAGLRTFDAKGVRAGEQREPSELMCCLRESKSWSGAATQDGSAVVGPDATYSGG